MFYVYIHTTPDGKVYVGETKQPVRRWQNGDGYADNEPFYSAIQMYGWNSIKHEIVMACNTESEARIFEAVLIDRLKSEDSERGYNKSEISARLTDGYAKRTKVDAVGLEKEVTGRNIFEDSGLPISVCSAIVDQWIFNKRYREIVKSRLLDGLSYPELSKLYGLSVRQLKTIMGECTQILSEHL